MGLRKLKLENSLLIMDEVHKFLSPLNQFKKKYKALENVIKNTQNIKLCLLTGTPIYRNFTDLTKIINLKNNSRWLTLNNLLIQFYDLSDKYLVKIFLGPVAIATYSIPQQLTGKLSIFSKKLSLKI